MKKQLPKISTTSKALGKSLLLAQSVLDQAKKYSTLPFTQAHIIRPRIDENIIAGHITVSFSHFYQNRIVT